MAQETDSQEITHYHDLTPQQQAIVDALKMGNTRTASWQYAGVSHQTFYNWMRDNLKFLEAVTRAEATAEVGHVGVLAHAAIGGDWRASLEWLKRRRRVEWGDSIDIRKLDDDTLLRLLATEEGSGEAGLDSQSATELSGANSET